MGGDLADLILPSACAGCGAERVPLRYGTCASCVTELEALRPYPTAPTPSPVGMPACVAAGAYAGALRQTLLAYKERGRHRLAGPLGAVLAASIAAAAVWGGGGRRGPVVVVPVPSTAAAVRERHGDHMARLTAHAVRRLRDAGWQARMTRPLRALPRPDSASLDVSGRAAAAESSLRIRGDGIRIPRRRPTIRGTLIVVDDIVTTGATLAAVTSRLREVDMQVTGAAVLAATRLRRSRAAAGGPGVPWSAPGPEVPPSGCRTRGDGRASAG
ncbi:ComF family protein [Actinoplanes sp. RD1]|uniref:ComF family protein n=1 Tax=Actinoplanes sp. RD1 TaxID=3064538 RepID=UPI00274092C3|nr:phosphoribosyltransferase family protein [Actinoplanes sp. RD1]